jgi:hypothetical protein
VISQTLLPRDCFAVDGVKLFQVRIVESHRPQHEVWLLQRRVQVNQIFEDVAISPANDVGLGFDTKPTDESSLYCILTQIRLQADRDVHFA